SEISCVHNVVSPTAGSDPERTTRNAWFGFVSTVIRGKRSFERFGPISDIILPKPHRIWGSALWWLALRHPAVVWWYQSLDKECLSVRKTVDWSVGGECRLSHNASSWSGLDAMPI